eukprot:233875_1
MVSAKKRTQPKKSTGKGKSNTVFPSGRIGSLLRKGRFSKRVSKSAGTYAAGVISYLARELLEVCVKGAGKKAARISPRMLTLAVRADDELGNLLKDVTISRGGVPANANAALEKKKKVKKTKKAGSKKAAKKSVKKSKK